MDRCRPAARTVLLTLLRSIESDRGARLAPADLDQFYPVDVKRAASLLGWQVQEVHTVTLTTHGRRAQGHCFHDRKVIEIATYETDPIQQRWTLAHELGHAVLHARSAACVGGMLSRPRHSSRRGTAEQPTPEYWTLEREADVFARELLTPERAVKEVFLRFFDCARIRFGSPIARNRFEEARQTPPSMWSPDGAHELANALLRLKRPPRGNTIAEYFSISRTAMRIRLLELGLVF